MRGLNIQETYIYLGAGANQAIEVPYLSKRIADIELNTLQDAFILSHLLGSPLTSKKTLPLALAAYERVRLPRANRIIKSSSDSGDCIQFRREQDCERMFEDVNQVSRILVEGDPDEDLRLGMAWLEEQSK